MLIGHRQMQDYTVVHAQNAMEGEINALTTFVDMVARVTGYTLPVVADNQPAQACEIIFGMTNRDTPMVKQARETIQNDGYAMVMDGQNLYITGSMRRGGVYGLYAFMENYLGVRFYADIYTHIDKTRVVDVPADLYRVYSPAFFSRDTFWYHILTPRQKGSMIFPHACKVNRGEMPDLGGGVSYAGGFVHTLAALAEMPHEVGLQPCLTDENVFQTVRKNVRKWLDEHPTATIVSVSQNDSYAEQLGCQCERCKAIDDREGTPMGSMLTFVNRIAEDIKEDYPHVYVDTLAYRYTRKAPKTVRPADNVIIRLCSIECCFSHPLDDPDCPHNVEFAKDIEEWSSICNNLYIWDYTTDFLCYLAPYPNLAVLRANVNFFKNHHAIGVFEQGNSQSPSGEFGELRGYLLAKLLWEPDMTEERYQALMNEFLRDYYGAGWTYIREYIDLTSRKAAERHLHIYDVPNKTFPFAEDDKQQEMAFAETLLTLWQKALMATETDEQHAHVLQSSIQALYYAEFVLPPERFDELNVLMLDAMRACGVSRYRETADVPDFDDPNAYPDLR